MPMVRIGRLASLTAGFVCGAIAPWALAGGAPSAPAALAPASPSAAARVFEADDIYRTLAIDSLACSHDGAWIAYSVTRADREGDENKSSLWMVNWQGNEHVRLTEDSDGASSPAFSPDGRWISYLAERPAEGRTQLFLLDRALGGRPAQAITNTNGDILEYRWSPDGRKIVLSIAAGGSKTPEPIVIDRLRFKQERDDGTGKKGYITDADRSQLQLLDVETRALVPLTSDARFDDTAPAWSPDGRRIAFVSPRESDIDRTRVAEIYVIDARPGATPRKLVQFFAPDRQSMFWTADGREIVHTAGAPPRLDAYVQDHLAQVEVASGEERPLAPGLDRVVSFPALIRDSSGRRDGRGDGSGDSSADASSIAVLVDDDLNSYPAMVEADGVRRLLTGKGSVTEQCAGGAHLAALASNDAAPPEVYAVEAGTLRKLSTHNDALLSELHWGSVEEFAFRGADGASIHGLLTKPPGYAPGHRYPTILWIHGGPNMQDTHGLAFDNYPLQLERQWFAAHGYVVLAVNYHGSSGRGVQFAGSIVGDWGNKEVEDLLAAADYAVRSGIADPQRLGIGGWSYGGILTDYVIASDGRFGAAISGAGSANQLSMYGSDQFVRQYNAELGPPWEHADSWLRLSYPFFHAERIHTPTLFLGGEKDMNVPIAGGEQMYEALRTLGVPTRLVVYPGETHYLERPSFIKDRLQRYLEWYDRFLNPSH